MLKSVGTCVCDLYFNLVGKYCCIYGCMWSIVYFRTQLKSKYFSGLDLGMISYVVGFYKFGEKHLFTPFRCVLSLIFTFTILLSKSKFWLWYYNIALIFGCIMSQILGFIKFEFIFFITFCLYTLSFLYFCRNIIFWMNYNHPSLFLWL